MKRMIAAFAVASLALVASARADVRLPRIFTHHMVLQQELPIAVWGWADPGEKVSAALDDARPVSTTADADGRNRDYHHDMKSWIESWRTLWNRPDMPFYFVQIAPTTYAGGAMQYVWESQVWVMDHVPHTGLAVSNDILPERAVKTDPASGFPKAGGSNPHPPNKHIVAERLANIALVETYQRADRVLYGPMYESHKVEGRKILIKFRYTGGGLATRDGRPPNWFQVAPELPEDKRHPDPYHHFRRLELVPAEAQVVGPDTVAVEVPPEVKEPKYLTFAWNCEARHNLMNKEGLPAVSFRVTLGEPVAGATRLP